MYHIQLVTRRNLLCTFGIFFALTLLSAPHPSLYLSLVVVYRYRYVRSCDDDGNYLINLINSPCICKLHNINIIKTRVRPTKQRMNNF